MRKIINDWKIKKTLSGLFYDIATPAFKHCVDFLDGDYMNQESAEDLTTEIIKNSSKIMGKFYN